MPESAASSASIVPEACNRYIGMESTTEVACDPVERGAVRRFAQAIMDEDPIYWEPTKNNERFGGPVAPPLYTAHIFRRPFGTEDPLTRNAHNPDFDGLGATASQGLPELEPLKGYALLNGGIEVEFLRYARHGETVSLKSRYASITGKETSKGPMIFVVIESEYRTGGGELLIRTRRTQIRRK
jgi:acyl dehydratase